MAASEPHGRLSIPNNGEALRTPTRDDFQELNLVAQELANVAEQLHCVADKLADDFCHGSRRPRLREAHFRMLLDLINDYSSGFFIKWGEWDSEE